MGNIITEGDTSLLIETKLNNLNSLFQIAETNDTITAGNQTSIPVTTTTQDLLFAGDTIYLQDDDTGELHALTLDGDLLSGEAVIGITSHNFATDIQAGAKIYYSYADLLNRIYTHLSP